MVPFVLSISAIPKTKKHSISLSIKMSHQCYHQHFSMPQNTRQSWRPSPNANALLKNTNVSFLYYTIKIRGTRMTHIFDHITTENTKNDQKSLLNYQVPIYLSNGSRNLLHHSVAVKMKMEFCE